MQIIIATLLADFLVLTVITNEGGKCKTAYEITIIKWKMCETKEYKQKRRFLSSPLIKQTDVYNSSVQSVKQSNYNHVTNDRSKSNNFFFSKITNVQHFFF